VRSAPWVYLKSAGDSPLANYDIIASDPVEIFRGHRAWDALEDKLRALPPAPLTHLPFVDGYIGYITYEGEMWLMRPGKIDVTHRKEPSPATQTEPLCWTPHLSRDEYCRKIEKILHHIREGDIYQANFAQTFSAPLSGDPFAFWQHLTQKNPAAFFAYIDDGEQQILCTSPERLLKQWGRDVESRPIKGTCPRGKTPEDDARLREALLTSPKEAAELAMIVDLVRNDLHQSCVTGSVTVAAHRVIEKYTNVFHQVSVVTGQLPTSATTISALKHLFPGGSITGCPKIRAMEIIRELEGTPRGIYTGSIGYASTHGTQDWNIAIRTAVVKNGRIYLSVGGGIVADSDPEKEYEETLHKAASFFSTPTHSK
jgi:para-aminobenzoate synthetase component 1